MRNPALLVAALVFTGLCFAAEPAAYEGEGIPLGTGSVSGEMSLVNGVTLRVAPRSTGTVFSDHLVLEQGAVRVENFSGYTLDADQLHIQAQDPAARAVVRISNNTVEVASLGGNLNITGGGAMLTRVTAGTRVAFRTKTQSGKSDLPSDQHVMYWIIGISAVAALAIGITAAVQGKSPF